MRKVPEESVSDSNLGGWAEGLIRQLPSSHEGRNSWLLNYGVSKEAFTLRIEWERANGRKVILPPRPYHASSSDGGPSPVPEEWQLVPKEPTLEMLQAGYVAWLRADKTQVYGEAVADCCYCAMLAASPAVPSLGGEGENCVGLSRTTQQAGAPETAWMIERDGKWWAPICSYFGVDHAEDGKAAWNLNWNSDPNKGLRYARKADAEAAIKEQQWQTARATAHIWLPSSADNQPHFMKEMRDALALILPMAKGYAQANPVGSNAEYICYAESMLTAALVSPPPSTPVLDLDIGLSGTNQPVTDTDSGHNPNYRPPFPRPTTNSADGWMCWLAENRDCGNDYLAVQIAEAMDDLAAASAFLDRMQAVRVLLTDETHGVCVGGRYDGWLMWKHPDGQWVTMRKLTQENPQPAQTKPIEETTPAATQFSNSSPRSAVSTTEKGGALQKLEAICEEIFDRWDADQRSGKLLSALSGRLKRYRPDVTEVRRALASHDDVVAALRNAADLLSHYQTECERQRQRCLRPDESFEHYVRMLDEIVRVSEAIRAALSKATGAV
jgi:hypothetical protein